MALYCIELECIVLDWISLRFILLHYVTPIQKKYSTLPHRVPRLRRSPRAALPRCAAAREPRRAVGRAGGGEGGGHGGGASSLSCR